MDEQVRHVEDDLHALMLTVPNLPLPQVPVGPDESGNVVTQVRECRALHFRRSRTGILRERLGIIDFSAGSRFQAPGSMCCVATASSARALITWMLDLHTQKHGYQEVYPPYLVLEQALYGTGNLPKFGATLFRDIDEDKWLIPTAEVPVTNLYRDEILEESMLPIYHTAYTACFRREQISAGKDVRGIKRGYQFDKVEMVNSCTPISRRPSTAV
ncbi:MAG: aminoacyl--tRNA ligase-related protein [Thermomicrobiales bacterium]